MADGWLNITSEAPLVPNLFLIYYWGIGYVLV